MKNTNNNTDAKPNFINKVKAKLSYFIFKNKKALEAEKVANNSEIVSTFNTAQELLESVIQDKSYSNYSANSAMLFKLLNKLEQVEKASSNYEVILNEIRNVASKRMPCASKDGKVFNLEKSVSEMRHSIEVSTLPEFATERKLKDACRSSLSYMLVKPEKPIVPILKPKKTPIISALNHSSLIER